MGGTGMCVFHLSDGNELTEIPVISETNCYTTRGPTTNATQTRVHDVTVLVGGCRHSPIMPPDRENIETSVRDILNFTTTHYSITRRERERERKRQTSVAQRY